MLPSLNKSILFRARLENDTIEDKVFDNIIRNIKNLFKLKKQLNMLEPFMNEKRIITNQQGLVIHLVTIALNTIVIVREL